MVGAINLFEADHLLLRGPVERQVDMRGEFQIGQFSALGDRLNDFGREERQPDQAGDVTISNTFAAGDRYQRSRPPGDEFIEPPMSPCDRFRRAASGVRGGASPPVIMSRISTPRRFMRSAMNRVNDSIAAAPWVPSTDKGRFTKSSMPPGFSSTYRPTRSALAGWTAVVPSVALSL